MKKNTVITISRQFGSGGREIAQSLSNALSIPFYNKEIIVEAAKKSGLDENLFKDAEDRTVSSFLYAIALGTYSSANLSLLNMNETVFQTQAKVMMDLAEQGSCVFVGRAADYVLRNRPDVYKLFIYADLPQRIERVQKLYGFDAVKAEETIIKTDKKRASYYNYYTGQKWNAVENYDLCINSAKLGIAGTVEMILSYIRL